MSAKLSKISSFKKKRKEENSPVLPIIDKYSERNDDDKDDIFDDIIGKRLIIFQSFN